MNYREDHSFGYTSSRAGSHAKKVSDDQSDSHSGSVHVVSFNTAFEPASVCIDSPIADASEKRSDGRTLKKEGSEKPCLLQDQSSGKSKPRAEAKESELTASFE